MAAIDATARVADGARIGNDVEIGPYCLVGPDVELKDGVRLISHVSITGVTTIGEGTLVYPFASLGTPPQSVHYHGEPTKLIVGPGCQVRENVTMNTGTVGGGGVTRVGARCFFMVSSHVAHDCDVGDDVTFANNAVIGGHASIGNNVFLGGNCAVHQFCRIGEGVMLSGLSGAGTDIVPFGFAFGTPLAKLTGLNVVGLRRRGASRSDLQRLRLAYRALFRGQGVFADRIESVATEFADNPFVQKAIAFIRAGGKRSLMHPPIANTAQDGKQGGKQDGGADGF
jgi:UDP-N-acetylglucosamine acyltransferase